MHLERNRAACCLLRSSHMSLHRRLYSSTALVGVSDTLVV